MSDPPPSDAAISEWIENENGEGSGRFTFVMGVGVVSLAAAMAWWLTSQRRTFYLTHTHVFHLFHCSLQFLPFLTFFSFFPLLPSTHPSFSPPTFPETHIPIGEERWIYSLMFGGRKVTVYLLDSPDHPERLESALDALEVPLSHPFRNFEIQKDLEGEKYPILGLDAEWRPHRKPYLCTFVSSLFPLSPRSNYSLSFPFLSLKNHVALLQVSSCNVVLLQRLHLIPLSSRLCALLENPAIYKSGVGIQTDARLLM